MKCVTIVKRKKRKKKKVKVCSSLYILTTYHNNIQSEIAEECQLLLVQTSNLFCAYCETCNLLPIIA